jgi:hypothetical protein
MNYINEQSFKCLLGPQAKEIIIKDNLFRWKVGKKYHFTVQGILSIDNIKNLQAPCNFHYLDEVNLAILKKHFNVSRSKNVSIILDIQDLQFTGNKNKKIRHCLNRCAKEEFLIENNFRKIDDVKKLIDNWSTFYTDKYFRDNSGKNVFFYKNNFHQNLASVFIYKEQDLVAFGTLSDPIDGYSSYILGKALYKSYYGLSEFADVELYKMGQAKNIKYVNMGQASKGLLEYKTQFTHTKVNHYDGSIEI